MSLEPIIIILIAPLVTLFYLFISRKHAEEDTHILIRDSVFYGIVGFVVSMLLISLMDSVGLATTRSLNRTLFYSFVVVGFLEELPKVLLFVIVINKKEAFNSPTKGILFAIGVALGFVVAKNAYFVLTNGGGHFSEASGFYSVPAHVLMAIVMGFFISYGKFTGSRFVYPVLALGSAAFFHGLYQLALFSDDRTLLLIFFGINLIMAVMLFRKAMNTSREDIDHIDHQKMRKEMQGKSEPE